jgi:molybdenum cofactor cytidylyltransferase
MAVSLCSPDFVPWKGMLINMKTGAVIAAAGMSSHMKSFKPLLQLGGSTIIRTAITTLQAAGIQEIVVIIGNNAELLLKHLASTGVTCLYNVKYAQTDMFYSACMGMRYIMDKCDRAFFLPADVPLFSCQSLLIMLGYMDCNDCEILLPAHEGKSGHPVIMECSAIPSLISYNAKNGLKEAIDNFNGKKNTIELEDVGMTLDADKPGDYEQLKMFVRAETMKEPLNCSVKIGVKRKYMFFDSELCELLHEVDQCDSLNKACKETGMAYSKGWKIVKIAEHQLGFNLLDSRVGGNYGGGSALTDQCRKFIGDYENFLSRVQKYAYDTFRQQFAAYQTEECDKSSV